jgi:hypothetical protein
MLLLTTTSASDYSCLLIFTTVVSVDALLVMGKRNRAIALLFLYMVACAPVPTAISSRFPLRLLAITTLYLLLLNSAVTGDNKIPAKYWMTTGAISVALLTIYNLHIVRYRDEDFGRRISIARAGPRLANPVAVAGGVAFTEMHSAKYDLGFVTKGAVDEIPMSGDVLAVAGSNGSPQFDLELVRAKSYIVKLPAGRNESFGEVIVEGQEPTVSPNGKWLAFIRGQEGRGGVWLQAVDSNDAARLVLPSTYRPIDATVTDDGDVIAAAGEASDPHLLLVKWNTQEVARLIGFPHPTRYPSISPDGLRLAFTRRDGGSWHLMVRSLATGDEKQLTHAACNATSPSWENAETVLYATDCGRGVGLSALTRAVVPNLALTK